MVTWQPSPTAVSYTVSLYANNDPRPKKVRSVSTPQYDAALGKADRLGVVAVDADGRESTEAFLALGPARVRFDK